VAVPRVSVILPSRVRQRLSIVTVPLRLASSSKTVSATRCGVGLLDSGQGRLADTQVA
jgi:hypothetical protein